MRLQAAESALIELSRALTQGFRANALYPHIVVALGLRSRSLYQSFTYCIEGPAPAGSLALLRPLVEINILLRFLAQWPEERSSLWMAERHRWALSVVSDIRESPELREQWETKLPSDERLESWRTEIDAARAAAIKAGVPGVPEKGRLIPQTSDQVRLLNDPAVTEAYVAAYRRLSGDIHGGLVSFHHVAVDDGLGDGWLSLSDDVSPQDAKSSRVLALTTFASTLRLVGLAVNLPIVEAADALRTEFLRDGSGSTITGE